MSDIPIFLASDDNYAPYVATTMASICYNTKSFIDFYILDGGISGFNKKQLEALKKNFRNFSIEFIGVKKEEFFKDFRVNKHFTSDMYSRFLISQLKPNIEKGIYLDVDIIALGDIAELFNEDLGEYALGAVPKYLLQEDHTRWKATFDLSDKHKYFNSGVLLLDLKKWRATDTISGLFEIEQSYREKLQCPDQDILNKRFDNDYMILDGKYNIMTNEMHQKGYVYKEPLLRHFNGSVKPWHATSFYNFPIQHFNEFWFFASMTHFYPGLQMQFIANTSKLKSEQTEFMNAIKKPSPQLLEELRQSVKKR